MLFKAVLLFDACDFSGKSLKQSLPHHQLSSLTEGKCMPKAEAPARCKAEHPSFQGALGGRCLSLQLGNASFHVSTKTIQSLHQDEVDVRWKGDKL